MPNLEEWDKSQPGDLVEIPSWDLSHFAKLGIFMGIL